MQQNAKQSQGSPDYKGQGILFFSLFVVCMLIKLDF